MGILIEMIDYLNSSSKNDNSKYYSSFEVTDKVKKLKKIIKND